MNDFTGFGAGSSPSGRGVTPGKALVWGATAGLGWEAGNWLAYQRERYQRWRAGATTYPTQQADSAKDMEENAQIMFMAWEGLIEVRDWMATKAGPVEEWEGDLRINIHAVQFIEKVFPDVFSAWRKRNYPSN